MVSWQGLIRSARWYVPEPWAGHIGAAAILFVSSNPSAVPRGERFDPGRHMSRRDSDGNLFAAADGAFDDPRFPGIAGGRFNRDRSGRRTGRAVPFWRWTQGLARELLGREPAPGRRLRTHRGRALREPERDRGSCRAGTCTSRYLRRVLAVSPARVVVVVGATARGSFEDQLRAQFTGNVQQLSRSAWIWRRGQLLGLTRYVLALPHPNARVPAHDVARNLGPQLTAEVTAFLRSDTKGSDGQHTGNAATWPGRPGRTCTSTPRPCRSHRPQASSRARASTVGAGFAITTRKRDRNGDPSLMPGLNYVVAAVRTPWESGVVRVIHVTGADPHWSIGQPVDLVNASTGLRPTIRGSSRILRQGPYLGPPMTCTAS